jgi:hypothetical protein
MYWERFIPLEAAAWFIGTSSSRGALNDSDT